MEGGLVVKKSDKKNSQHNMCSVQYYNHSDENQTNQFFFSAYRLFGVSVVELLEDLVRKKTVWVAGTAPRDDHSHSMDAHVMSPQPVY